MRENLFAVILHGYDFEPQVVALSYDFDRACQLADKSLRGASIFPWNDIVVLSVRTGEILDFEGKDILYNPKVKFLDKDGIFRSELMKVDDGG